MFTATTDGSFKMMPRPRTYTRVLAVPRSMAMSRPSRENRLSAIRFDSPRSQLRGMSPKVGEALPSRLGSVPIYLSSTRFTPPTMTGLSGDTWARRGDSEGVCRKPHSPGPSSMASDRQRRSGPATGRERGLSRSGLRHRHPDSRRRRPGGVGTGRERPIRRGRWPQLIEYPLGLDKGSPTGTYSPPSDTSVRGGLLVATSGTLSATDLDVGWP